MKAVNLFVLSREQSIEEISDYENLLSQRLEKTQIKKHEYKSIRSLVELLLGADANMRDLDGFFYSFTIDQIGKEFDLIKFDKDRIVLNIELKSQDVGQDKIQKQFEKNYYYLKHLAPKINLFMYIEETDSFFTYEHENIRECTVRELMEIIREIGGHYERDQIEKYFQSLQFLISPLNTSEKFLNGQYFLTLQQEKFKHEILKTIRTKQSSYIGITGTAGTGKTLLLYDLAKEMPHPLIIHSGILCEGHLFLNNACEKFQIVSPKDLDNVDWKECDSIFIDESQRLHTETFREILKNAEENRIPGVFSYDSFQTLSNKEVETNIERKLEQLKGFQKYKLSTKIRTNKEMGAFISDLLHLGKGSLQYTYSDVDIIYANNQEEADNIVEIYRSKKYVFIGYTQSRYYGDSIDHYVFDYNTHHVIGQEFDAVITILDEHFQYDENGNLQAGRHPNPDYLFYKMFYQAISRAREKLCVLVVGNHELFQRLVAIKMKHCYRE